LYKEELELRDKKFEENIDVNNFDDAEGYQVVLEK